MKTIIAGSREYPDPAQVYRVLNKFHKAHPITEVISGCAIGPDTYGIAWANVNTVPVKRFPVTRADWRTHGKKAGMLRNAVMAEYAKPSGALIAFWDGKSRGTKDMIALATTGGLLVWVQQPTGLTVHAPQLSLL